MPHRLVVIDGNSVMHRAFHALPLLSTQQGQYTNAVYGFTTMLFRLLKDIQPDSVVVAFDKGKFTFRNEEYSEYKAKRQSTPEELREQFPMVQELLRAFSIPVCEQAGFEADDVIGTIAVRAAAAGKDVLVVTGDRDALQLIGPRVKVLLMRRGLSDIETYDETVLQQKYGLQPAQICDLKGLMGDVADNIPGVPGVGEKTALKLLHQFGTVENVLAHISEIAGAKLQSRLREHSDLALLSKRLATIVCHVTGEFSCADSGFRPDWAKVQQLFTAWEFHSLLERLPPQLLPAASPAPDDAVVPPAPESQAVAAASVLANARAGKIMYMYPLIEGRVRQAHFTGVAILAGETACFLTPQQPEWRDFLDVLPDEAVQKITYDAKAAMHAAANAGVALHGLAFDTMVAAYLLDPIAADYPPAALARRYLGESVEWQDKTVPHDANYAMWQATHLPALAAAMRTALSRWDMDRLYNDVEQPLIGVLAAMEYTGVAVAEERLKAMAVVLGEEVAALLRDIYRLAGEEFNVNSTRQLGAILFDKLGLPVQKKTKTGYSTDVAVLEKLVGLHPIIEKILSYRQLIKLKGTYLDGLAGLINQQTGRIHTTFNQTVTATGRLSSSDPNLQNIPIRTEIGRRIRELFVPAPDMCGLLSADYSQIELRVLAHMSGDGVLIDAFRRNQDIHTRTAAEVFGVSMAEVTPAMRSRAKAVNFGIIYGISDYGLAQNIGVSRQEAAAYIASYFARYPGVKAFMDGVVAQARQSGYVTTTFNRRRNLPDIRSSNFNQRSFAERTAMNTPIQGSAADIIKIAMVRVYAELQRRHCRSRLLLQVHDELVLEVAAGEEEAVTAIVKNAMENAVSLAVPLLVDVKMGPDWAAAK